MLTKTDIESFIRCPRQLWLEHNPLGPDLPLDATAERRKSDGNAVGAEARRQLGDHLIWPASDADKEIAFTEGLKLLAARPTSPAVEVPFVYDSVYARVDALIPLSPGVYILSETKASTFPLKDDKVTPAKPEKHHVDDIAIQAYLTEQLGFLTPKLELNLLNSRWVYPGGGDYSGLFRPMDVTELASKRMADVPALIVGAKATLGMEEMPQATTGRQCKNPHACPFFDFCLTLEPEPEAHPISLLPGPGGKALAARLSRAGHISLVATPAELLVGADSKKTEQYLRLQRAHKSGHFELSPDARGVIDAIAYPRHYFDFEGLDLPVPRWAGCRPYQQVPFQFSCHTQMAEGEPLTHSSFLDLTGEDPSLQCIKAMEIALGPNPGSVLVFFAAYERTRMLELAERFPAYAPLLLGWVEKIVDLLPIVQDYFYDPVMCGSFSIKKVLKAIAPKMDYALLEEVQDGTGAQLAYIEAAFDAQVGAERKLAIRRNLTTYCGQDTFAMVVVAHFMARRPVPQLPEITHHLMADRH